MKDDLREMESRWALAIQNAGVGVGDLDPCGQTVRYSPQRKAMLGYDDRAERDSTSAWWAPLHSGRNQNSLCLPKPTRHLQIRGIVLCVPNRIVYRFPMSGI